MALPSSIFRGHVILGIICGMAAVAAVMGVAQLWWAPFSGTLFYKSLATVALLGVMAGIVAAIDIDMTGGRARVMMLLLMAIVLIGGVLGLGQLWWQWMDVAVFVKIAATLLIVVVLLAFFMAAYEDFGTARQLKDDKYID